MVRLLTALHRLFMNWLRSVFIWWNSSHATDSSMERFASSLMILVRASSKLPVVNS